MSNNRIGNGAGSHKPEFSKIKADSADIKYLKGPKKGKKKERLVLRSDNKTYAIAAKKLAPGQGTSRIPFRKKRYVVIKRDEGNVEVNIRSAAKRLGISHQEVRALADNENAMTALEDRAKIREEAVKRYQEIINSYCVNRSRLQTRKSENESLHKTGIKPKTLLKVIEKGLDISDDDVNTKPGEITVKNHKYRVSEEGEISDIIEQLGKGAYGSVHKTFNLNKAKMKAMKDAHGDDDAKNQLKNEYNVHKHLRGGTTSLELEGIQSCPSEISVISTSDGEAAFYQTDLASGDLTSKNPAMKSFSELPLEDKLKLCRQLLSGLSTAHGKNVVHGDIKPENCLMETDTNGKPKRFVIADWGGAGINTTGEVFSPAFRPSDYEGGSVKEGQRSDVFATSITIIETLLEKELRLPPARVGNFSEPVQPNSTTADDIEEGLKEKGISDEVIKVLISGLGPKANRPDAQTLKLSFDTALSNMN